MQPLDPSIIVQRLAQLREEHRDLDLAIARLVELPGGDQLQIKRLKKRKLALKDSIIRYESMLIPNLDA